MPGSEDRRASIELDPTPRQVTVGRRFVRDMLTDWRIEALIPAAELVVSELVSNGVLHARSPLELSLCADSRTLLVEVSDDSPSLPSRRRYSTDATTGRGLALIEALTTGDWGSRREGDGKVVWARLRSDADGSGDPLLDLFGDLDLDDLEGFEDEPGGTTGPALLLAG